MSERTWIIEKCLKLLSNNNKYENVHLLTIQINLDKKCTDMEEIAVLADAHLSSGKQLSKLL